MNSHVQAIPVATQHTYPRPIEQFMQNPLILLAWYRRAQSRIALSKLDAHLLNDIGVSAQCADVETRKPFWKD